MNPHLPLPLLRLIGLLGAFFCLLGMRVFYCMREGIRDGEVEDSLLCLLPLFLFSCATTSPLVLATFCSQSRVTLLLNE